MKTDLHATMKARLLELAREAAASPLSLGLLPEPIRHLAQTMRAWCAEMGYPQRGILEPEDFEEAQLLYYARRVDGADAEEEEEGEESEAPSPSVSIYIGESAYKTGPWRRVPSKIVALYLADFIDEKIRQIAGPDSDVIVDTAPRKRIPAWTLANNEQTRKFWMDRVATWIEEFHADGWRDFAELVDGSGEVPR